MIFLNKNEQRMFEEWKDSTLTYFDGWDSSMPVEDAIESTRNDFLGLVDDTYFSGPLSEYKEIQKILDEFFADCDFNKVADKICYEYIPAQRGFKYKKR